ncbi:MAG: hypothetical protein NWR72_13185 [Bacteroidia bacterium]|nr:hypothetical protein [Bacteroidia bacterium]
MNYSENNHKTLRDAIKKLPAHQAPADLWDRLAHKLDEQQGGEQGRESLSNAISALPVHPAPASVWRRVEQALDGRKQYGWVRPAIGMAAAVGITFALWLTLPTLEIKPSLAESEFVLEVPSEASLTEWEQARELEETRVFTCVDSAAHSPQLDSLTQKYLSISLSLDSLAHILQSPEPHDATLGRFNRLEMSRKQTLARIETQACR